MKNLVKVLLRFIIKSLGLNKAWLPYMWISDQIDRVVNIDGMIFDANTIPSYYRGMNAKHGEVDTIKWIETEIKKDEVLYDIGANCGTFTILAAIKNEANVFAFEPESSNYAILNHNIFLNNLSDRVKAFNIALSDKNEIANLNLSKCRVGGSCHNFGEELDLNHKKFIPSFKQGAMGMSLDSFVFDFNQPFPNHIKIDVDGIEYKIINGMEKILQDKRLKSMAIELNNKLKTDVEIIEKLEKIGFKMTHSKIKEGIVNNFFIRKED